MFAMTETQEAPAGDIEEVEDHRSPGLRAAIKKKKTIQGLADALGLKRQAVSQWSEIPLNRVKQVAEATGLSKRALRPDYF